MNSNSLSPSRTTRNRSNLKTVSREIILGCVEGGLKALSLIDKDAMVADVVYHKGEYLIRVEKEV